MSIKAFRLFVSSTFADFAQERELLQGKVFPALDAYCAAKGYQFLPLDLRWGVSEEAQLDQRTAEICLGEVRAAKDYPPPNFLIMTGNRYGWVPLPYAIARDEFEAVIAWLKRRWRWGAARALRTVYQLDENHLVPLGLIAAGQAGDELVSAYTLRSREGDIPELRSAKLWVEFEARLRRILQQAADHLLKRKRINAAAHQKYFLSVTEQEIMLGLPGYKRGSATGASFSPPSPASDGLHATAFIREIARSTSRALAPTSGYFEQEPLVDVLKDQIKRVLPAENLITVKASFDKDGKLHATYLADFATAIQRKLEAAIDRHIALVSAIEQNPDYPLQSERNAHHAFAEQKRKVFVGRANNLAAIASYIAAGGDGPLILHGRSGLGKSALLASAIAAAEQGGACPVIYRFVGASAASSDVRSLLISVVEDLASHGIVQQLEEFDQDANKFNDQIKSLLSSATKPVVIFVDALDQLRKPYRLGWFPDKLPTAMKLVASVLDDEAYETDSAAYRTLRQRLEPETFVEIEPLGAMDAHNILTALESDAGRRLQSGQRDHIIRLFEKTGASPLYLRTAFEIARSWKSSDRAGEAPHMLAEDTVALIAQFMRDLSAVHHHQPELVTRTLGYLTAAKDGLSEKELTDVLSRDRDAMHAISSEKHGARTDKLPASVWVRLHRQLAPFVIEKRIDDQPLLQFFHRQVAQVAREQYYETSKGTLHEALASYFDHRASGSDAETDRSERSVFGKRSLSELPFQLYHAGKNSRLDSIFLSPEWMEQKLASFGPLALTTDYEQFGFSPMHELIGRTLKLCSSTLALDSSQLHAQLIGRLKNSTDASASALLSDARRLVAAPAILPQTNSLTSPGAEIARLQISADQPTTMIQLSDGRLATGTGTGAVVLWDLPTGQEVLRINAHESSVDVLVELRNRRIASGSSDGAIRIWNVDTGAEVISFQAHFDSLNALAVLPDGTLASGSHDKTIGLWDVDTGVERGSLVGHSDWVTELAVLQDGRLVSASTDYSIRIWDVVGQTSTNRFDAGSGSKLAVFPDGRLAVEERKCVSFFDPASGQRTSIVPQQADLISLLEPLAENHLAIGTFGGEIIVWDIDRGVEATRLQGHTHHVSAVRLLPDNRVASASYDGSVRVWDLRRQAPMPGAVQSNSAAVTSMTLLADGRLAAGTSDGAIRLWDVDKGAETAALQGHTEEISALTVTSDDQLASCSKDGTIRMWTPAQGLETACLEAWRPEAAPLPLPFTGLLALRDGALISTNLNGGLQVWRNQNEEERRVISGDDVHVEAAIALKGNQVAFGVSDGSIRVWDAEALTETAKFVGHNNYVSALQLLAGERIASGSWDGSVLIWNLEDGTVIGRLEGHEGRVYALALLPSGLLASGAEDNSVRLWDMGKLSQVARLDLDGPIKCLVALPDGRIVAGDALGRIHWLELVT